MEKLERQTREQISQNAFMDHNYIELKSVERGRAVCVLTIRPESKNPYGLIHGGAIYTMADNATGAAAHTDGRAYVTQTSALHFLRNVSEGAVYATAVVRHRGKSTCLTAVDITSEDGRLLATGEFTFFCVDRAILECKGRKDG